MRNITNTLVKAHDNVYLTYVLKDIGDTAATVKIILVNLVMSDIQSSHQACGGPSKLRSGPVIAIGLLVSLLVAIVVAIVDQNRAATRFSTMPLVVIPSMSGLAAAILIWTTVNVSRRRRVMLISCCTISAILLLIAWGIFYPSWERARDGEALVAETHGITNVLIHYADANNGRLPGSLDELIGNRLIQETAEGTWIVSDHDSVEQVRLRDPAWFDIAWGIAVDQIDTNGLVSGTDRLVVRPKPDVNVSGLESACQIISTAIGHHFAESPDSSTTEEPDSKKHH